MKKPQAGGDWMSDPLNNSEAICKRICEMMASKCKGFEWNDTAKTCK